MVLAGDLPNGLGGQPLMVVLYEREERGRPGLVSEMPGLSEAPVLTAKMVKRTAGFRERFTRNSEHAVAFKSMLRSKGIRVVSITEHADDTPTGKLMEPSSSRCTSYTGESGPGSGSLYVVRGMRGAASKGFWISSRAPYGYNRVYVQERAKKCPHLEINETEAALVRRMFQMADSGSSLLEHHQDPQPGGRKQPQGKALTAAEAKSGKYTYSPGPTSYVCQSLLKQGSGSCPATPPGSTPSPSSTTTTVYLTGRF